VCLLGKGFAVAIAVVLSAFSLVLFISVVHLIVENCLDNVFPLYFCIFW